MIAFWLFWGTMFVLWIPLFIWSQIEIRRKKYYRLSPKTVIHFILRKSTPIVLILLFLFFIPSCIKEDPHITEMNKIIKRVNELVQTANINEQHKLMIATYCIILNYKIDYLVEKAGIDKDKMDIEIAHRLRSLLNDENIDIDRVLEFM